MKKIIKSIKTYRLRFLSQEKIDALIKEKLNDTILALEKIKNDVKITGGAIELSTYCNLNCLMCNTKATTREKGEIEWGTFLKAVDEFHKIGVNGVNFHTINEPLIDKRIIKMLDVLDSKGMSLCLSTNGMLVDKFLEQVKDTKLRNFCLRFSIDGATKETYEKIRVGANFEKLISNLEKTIDFKKKYFKKLHVCSNYIISQDTIDEVPLFIKKFKKYFNSIEFSLLNSLTPAEGQIYYKNSALSPKDYQVKPCYMLFDNLHILHNGDVSACCRDYTGDLIVGNIHKNSLSEIWNSDRMNNLREAHLNGSPDSLPSQCRNCRASNYFLIAEVYHLTDMTLKGVYKPEKLPELIKNTINKYNEKTNSIYEMIK